MCCLPSLKNWKKDGDDSVHSWIILLGCSIISFITSGLLYGPTGVLYVAYLDTKQCSAEEASWVIALTPAMSIIGGPLGAVLSTCFSIRTIITSGIFLATAGISVGFFSLNFYFLLATYGVLHGIGCTLASTALCALINNVFKKYRDIAMGIFTSVTPISGAIMPMISQALYEKYDLKGTLLILGGIYLHALFGVVLFVDKRKEMIDEKSFENDSSKDYPLKPVDAYKEVPQVPYRDENENDKSSCEVLIEKSPPKPRTPKTALQKMREIIKLYGFHLSNFTLVIGNFICLLFSLITVDAGIQKGLKVHYAVHLMSIYSAGQLIGRLILGWISDPKYVSKPMYFAVIHLIFSVVCVCFSFSYGFGVLLTLCALTGVILGNLNPLSKVVYSDYLKKDQMVIAMYMSYFLVGLLAVVRSALVGHIRDVYGNYNNVYYLMGGVSLLTSLVWTCEYIRLWRERTNKCNR